MRPGQQHRGEDLGKGARFRQSLAALWLREVFPEGSRTAPVRQWWSSSLCNQLPALWWELDSSYPPVAISCGDPCACCWPQKETSRADWLWGSLGRVLWNMPPVDVAPPKFKRYKSKFWKCIILYDKVWQRNAVFSFIVSYILFLWELMRMFSYLTCVLPSL